VANAALWEPETEFPFCRLRLSCLSAQAAALAATCARQAKAARTAQAAEFAALRKELDGAAANLANLQKKVSALEAALAEEAHGVDLALEALGRQHEATLKAGTKAHDTQVAALRKALKQLQALGE